MIELVIIESQSECGASLPSLWVTTGGMLLKVRIALNRDMGDGKMTSIRSLFLVIMMIACTSGCQPTSTDPELEKDPVSQANAPPTTDNELIGRIKSAAKSHLNADQAIDLMGGTANYDSEVCPGGVELFEKHEFDDGKGSTIAMGDIAAEARRFVFWNMPDQGEKDDVSIRIAGIVWKKDGTTAYFIGRFWLR